MKKLDIHNPSAVNKVGYLADGVISLLGLGIKQSDILLGSDRIKHIYKHEADFGGRDKLEKHLERLPEIIAKPDYVGMHPSGNSIEYIKSLDDVTLAAVRLKQSGALWARSMYPECFSCFCREKSMKSIDMPIKFVVLLS